MRVYPLPINSNITQRKICRLELARNPSDNRDESWKLTRDNDDSGIVETQHQVEKPDVVAWLGKNASPSINNLNERRRSIGSLKIPTDQIKGILRNRNKPDPSDPEQSTLFEDLDEHFGKEAISLAPYLEFRDADGPHCIQVREWGCYEFLRKNPTTPDQLWGAMRIDQPDSDVYLVVGNMCNRRNVWLVISWYVQPRAKPEKTLFDDEPD